MQGYQPDFTKALRERELAQAPSQKDVEPVGENVYGGQIVPGGLTEQMGMQPPAQPMGIPPSGAPQMAPTQAQGPQYFADHMGHQQGPGLNNIDYVPEEPMNQRFMKKGQ